MQENNESITINNEHLLLVEGYDDERFFRKFLTYWKNIRL